MNRLFALVAVLAATLPAMTLLGFRTRLHSTQGPGQAQRPPGVVYPNDFGARGDGRADDTAALQRALDQGGVIDLGAGTYRITRPLILDLARSGPTAICGHGTATLVMEGPGPALCIRGHHQGTADPHTLKPGLWRQERFPLIQGVVIVGRHREAHGIQAQGTIQLTLHQIAVRGVHHALWLRQRNRNVVVSDCHLYENRGVGLFLDRVNLHQINVTGCHISYNRQGGLVVRGGEVRNLQVTGCDIEANMHAESPPTANVLLDLREGSCREVSIVGCTIQHSARVPESANVRLLGRGEQDRRKVGNMVIANNLLSDAQYNIHLVHARGVVIQGNSLWRGFQGHVVAQASDHLLVVGNLMDRNPDYDRQGQGHDGLRLEHCRWVTVASNHGRGFAGPQGADVLVERSRHVLLHGNAFYQGQGSLALRRSRQVELRHNRILGQGEPAVRIEESEQVTRD